MSKTRVGFALTGSFCTFKQAFSVIEALVRQGYDVTPILSERSAREDTRFFSSEKVWKTLEELTGKRPLSTLPEVEPIGPKKLLDAYIIAPMTGASLGKMAHGIFDTPALLGAKSHLRNGRPVLVAPSTNDGLGANAQNLGRLLNTKNVFFVPFYQDDPQNKRFSLVSDLSLLSEAAERALKKTQLQPVIKSL